jgi:NDP-sugar pyrophosphorylase family protein
MVLPKPLVPVGDRPVLDIVVRQLRRDGFDHVTVATGYLAELIEAYFGDGRRHGVKIDYHREAEPLGTVGAIGFVEGLSEDFLVMNGDVLTDIDYRALLDRHTSSDAIATIATHERTVQISLGVLEMSQDSDPTRLVGYREKPSMHYEVSMGVYCFSPKVLSYIDRGETLDFPDLILRLIDANETVRGWRSSGYWLDIGRHEDYEKAMDEFEQMRDRLIPAE